jgi:hypothetical protein
LATKASHAQRQERWFLSHHREGDGPSSRPPDSVGEFNDGLWTLTHVPTGYIVLDNWRNEATALKLAEELQVLDWNFTNPEDLPAKTRTGARKIMENTGLA